MNVVNRILMILICLATVAAAVAVFLVATGLVEPSQLAPNWWFEDRLRPFATLDDDNQAVAIAVSAGLALLGLILLILELKPPAQQPKQMTLQRDERGAVTVSRKGIEHLATREATLVPGVMEFKPTVEEQKDGIRIRGRASVEPTSDLATISSEVQDRIKAAVEQHLGKRVSDVRVDAQLEPLESGRRVR